MQAAELLASKGMSFVEKIHTSGLKREDHDFELQWCRSRLLMDVGLSMMFDKTPNRKSSRHAMSMIGDAALCFYSMTDERARTDMALVQLRSADVRLHEAVTLQNKADFQTWVYNQLLTLHSTSDAVVCNGCAPSSKSRPPTDEALRMVNARTRDALRYLDRAEPLLRERRRNVWWTTWYFERRMRAISLLLWASVNEKGTPIPFLGLERRRLLIPTPRPMCCWTIRFE